MLPVLICIGIGIIFGYAISSLNLYVIILLLGVLFSVFVFIDSRIAYWVILVNIFLFSSLVGMYFPFIGRKAVWITDLTLLVLLFKIILEISVHRMPILRDRDFLMILVLAIFGVFSAKVNEASNMVIICGLRNYFKYIPLFFAVRYLFSHKDLVKQSLYFWLVVGILNVPMSLFQAATNSDWDAVGGLFAMGGSGILSFYQLIIIGYLLVGMKNGLIKKPLAVFLSVFLWIPLFVNETKITFFLFPLMIMYIYWKEMIKKPSYAVAIILFGIVVMMVMGKIYQKQDSRFTLANITSKEWLYDYLYKSSYYQDRVSLNRFSAVGFALQEIAKNPAHLFIGVGIGNASLSNFPGGLGFYFAKFPDLRIDIVFLSRAIWEYGLIGTGLFFLMMYLFYRNAVDVQDRVNDSEVTTYAQLFIIITMFLVVGAIYNLAIYDDRLACLYWSLAGFLNREGVA